MKPIRKLTHYLAHKLGFNEGTIETLWKENRLMVRFVCSGCGKIEGEHEACRLTNDVPTTGSGDTSKR
jgi:hypothetical protein